METFWPKIKENPLFALLVAVFLIASVIVLTLWARNLAAQYYYIGKNSQTDRQISISGEGKVTAIPDIATVTLGMENIDLNVQLAQKKNSDTINSLMAQLKALGIALEDIQTVNYNIYPQYDYSSGKQVLIGYDVSQNISVKIRDTGKVSDVLKIAGDLKLNQVGGLSFDIDKPEVYQEQAREKALQNAMAKADTLAKIMNVKLGKIISFSESSNTPTPYPIYADKAIGMGGGGTAPAVSAGSQDVISDVTIIYELN